MDAEAYRDERTALEARWLHLTRAVLPALAADHGWPIREDHCFMRVCLDGALGQPWRDVVRPPAYRNLSLAALSRAVVLAERVAADPALLPGLDRNSLRLRRERGQAPTLFP